MKIKELHLRNIASIEKADIDFEKGLCDGVTGTPASIFLISGDTGSGKSVILDGISMALYKTTPRIKGVANPKCNEFTSTEGESIRVGSIEQYTRLGISGDDECYSEVVFTGNDGVDYHARLTLGMILRTKRKTGEHTLEHRDSVWEVKKGNSDWTKDSVAQTIRNAIGLSFEQFGRMAMLAQGQFATFLTGDKKEREEILEQLTNTEHFSAYGEAIKSLFDKAKKERDVAQAIFDTESQHTLSQEKVDKLVSDKTRLETEKRNIGTAISKTGTQLTQVNHIKTGLETEALKKKEKADLEAEKEGDDYKSSCALINDWDTTDTERQALDKLKEARKKLAETLKEEAEEERRFAELSADLEARRDALRAQGNLQKEVDDKQGEINRLKEQYEELNPNKINSDLLSISDDEKTLSKISSRQEEIDQRKKDIEDLKKEIAKDQETATEKEREFEKLDKAYNDAKEREEEARNLLTTMKMSVGDTLTQLRRRLVDEKTDVCPLCGQRLEKIHLDEEFKTMLTPIEQKQEIAKNELEEAQEKREQKKKEFDNFEGTLKTKKEDLDKKIEKVDHDSYELQKDASRFAVDINKPLGEQIEAAKVELEKLHKQLRDKQSQAETILGKITAAREAKAPLDKALKIFDKDSQTVKAIEPTIKAILDAHPDWKCSVAPKDCRCDNIITEWAILYQNVSSLDGQIKSHSTTISRNQPIINAYCDASGKTEVDLDSIASCQPKIVSARQYVSKINESFRSVDDAIKSAQKTVSDALKALGIDDLKDVPDLQGLSDQKTKLEKQQEDLTFRIGAIDEQLRKNEENVQKLETLRQELDEALTRYDKWNTLNGYFGGTRFRTLVQTYILRPLLANANVYLEKITDRYKLTCNEDNEQLSILVLDRYNKDQVRSVTVLSGGERFMVSLALSLALSSLNRPDLHVNILFIDEGFGTLDEKSLDSVMETLERLQEIAGQSERRVGIISHREELDERIPVQIQVRKKGEGRSFVEIKNS